jgi:hypothetical protein
MHHRLIPFIASFLLMCGAVVAATVNAVLFVGDSNGVGRPDNLPAEAALQGVQTGIQYYAEVDRVTENNNLWDDLQPRSNTSWSVELSCLSNANASATVYGIKYAYGSQRLGDHYHPDTGAKYAGMTQAVNDAIAQMVSNGTTIAITDIYVALGANDSLVESHADAFGSNLIYFASEIRSDLGIPSARIHIPQTPTNFYPTYVPEVRTGKVAAVAAVSNMFLMGTDDLAIQSDNIHYEEASYVTIGERLATNLQATAATVAAESGGGTSFIMLIL